MAKLVKLAISPLSSFILTLREELTAKLGTLGISPFTPFILALREVLVAKLMIAGILSSTSFLTTSLFTTLVSLLKSTGTGTNFQDLISLFYFTNFLN